MEAGVVVVHPRDDPRHDRLIVAQQLVVAPLGCMPREGLPETTIRAQAARQLTELRDRQCVRLDHAATAVRACVGNRRAGLVRVIASHAAPPSGPGGAGGATTGRSEPCSNWSMPTTRTIASIARSPYEEVS